MPAGLIGVALAGCTSDEADEPQPELPGPAPELIEGDERRATVLDGGFAEGADGTVTDLNVIYVEGVGSSRNNWLHRWTELAQPGHQVYAYEAMVACYDSGRLIFTESDFRDIHSF